MELPGSNVNFGAFVEGIDLNDVNEDTFAQLRNAVYENQLVIIKGQQALTPSNHFDFVHRFDPTAQALHGHGTLKSVKETWKGAPSLLALGSVYNIPEAPGVRLVAAGWQGEDHYGLKDITYDATTIRKTQVNPPTKEEMDAGVVRFGRWHIDCAAYDLDPPKVTALRCLKLPQGREQTIRWDDGSGMEMKTRPGRTAYYNCEQLYEMLTAEEKAMADNSLVTYAPHPYKWISGCQQDTIGITIPQGQGKEVPQDQMPAFEFSKVKKYPMVWHNEVTGKPAFMVHAIIAQKLHIKRAANDVELVIDDVDEVRKFLYPFARRMVTPENVLVAPYEEGDIAVWNNRGMQHGFLEYPVDIMGPRTMHQVNIAASCPPS
ncbi:hypothetical protein LTR85_004893 [Meristemomyces frigidus]|nr:hypothetical protein LTR85_004893 [Meristemomyces frigidus]